MAVNLDKLTKVNKAREILEIVAAAPSTSWERIGEAVELLQEVRLVQEREQPCTDHKAAHIPAKAETDTE